MQFQVRTGPIQNNAATISPEMMQGYCPDRPQRILGKQTGQTLSQTTHVASAFSAEMANGAQGVQFPAPRLHRGKIGLAISETTPVDINSPEMYRGEQPSTPRLLPKGHLSTKFDQPISQTTHVSAPFSIEMVRPEIPVFDKTPARFTRADVLNPPDVSLFSVEMVQGYQPSRPKIMLGPRLELPLSQTSHIPAVFSIEMAAGSVPTSPRVFLAPRFQQLQVPDVQDFSIEMVQGWHPDRPVLMLGPRIALPNSQTTHVAAAITADMFAGFVPTSPRLFLAKRFQQLQVPDVSPFSNEMVQGSMPASPRLPRRIPPNLFNVPQVDIFSIEMVRGNYPDRARIHSPKRDGLSISQTTHTPAPITIDMLAGMHPDKPVLFYAPRFQQWFLVSAGNILPNSIVATMAPYLDRRTLEEYLDKRTLRPFLDNRTTEDL